MLDREAPRDVAVERIVGARLVGREVDIHTAAHDLGDDLGGVAEQPDRERAALAAGGVEPAERVVEVGGALVEVAGR